ncbi:Ig-like domain-containing protein [Vibrio sp. M260121]|uniref:Ig-like domain-containing protein n=1 Tax=Vibrio sp. M260121 TaxID=3020897 RepID=UPI002F3F02B3
MKHFSFLGLVMLILSISGCEYVANDPASPSDKDSSTQLDLVITAEKDVLPVGESQMLDIQLLDAEGKDHFTKEDTIYWESSDNNIATINEEGKLSGASEGKVVISASVERGNIKYTHSISIDVDAASMNYLYIKNLDDADFPVGITHEFQVFAAYSDGSTTELTQDSNLQCSLDNKQIASFTQEQNKSFITGISPGKTTLSCMLKNSQLKTSATFNITKAVIQKLDISSGTEELPVGLTHQFEAWATFSDNTVLDVTNDPNLSWSLSNTDIASVNNSDSKGLVKGLTPGSITVTASWVDLELTTSENLTITPPIITQLEMSLQDNVIPAGLSTTATVAATLSDKSVIDLTNDPRLTWSNSNPRVVTAEQTEAAYILVGTLSGQSTISAKLKDSNLQATADLTVSEPIISGVYITSEKSSIPAGLTGQLHAWARLSDNSVVEVTDHPEFIWSISDAQIASVSQSDHKGIVTGLKPGKVIVSGSMSKVYKATTSITIDEPIVTEIYLSESPKSLPAGLTHAYKAWAVLSDSSEIEVTNNPDFLWSVSDSSIATIEHGLLTTTNPGKLLISGELSNQFKTATSLTIDEPIVREIYLSANPESLPVGLSHEYKAWAIFSDNSELEVTNDPDLIWSVSDTSIATIERGALTAMKTGNVIISGVLSNQFKATTSLTIDEPIVTEVYLSANPESLPAGLSHAYQAWAIFSDNSELEVTHNSDFTWTVNDSSIATIEGGLLSTTKPGEIVISGILAKEFEAKTTLTIDEAVALELEIKVDESALPVGLTRPLKVHALLSDNTEKDVTTSPDLHLSVNNPTLAEITIDSQGMGIIVAHQIGSVVMEASGIFDNNQLTASKNLVVSEAVITQLSISSTTDEVVIGEPVQLKLNAVFSDNSEKDISSSSEVEWTTTDENIATLSTSEQSISIHGISEGEVTAIAKVHSLPAPIEAAKLFTVKQDYVLEINEHDITALSRSTFDGYDIDDIKIRQNELRNFDILNSTPRYINKPLIRLNDTYFRLDVFLAPFQKANFRVPTWFIEEVMSAQFVEEQPLFKSHIRAYTDIKPSDDKYAAPNEANVAQYEKELRGFKNLMNNYDYNLKFVSFIEEYMNTPKLVHSHEDHWCNYEPALVKSSDDSSSDEFSKFKGSDSSSNTVKHVSLIANKPSASYTMLTRQLNGEATIGDGWLSIRDYRLFNEGETSPKTTFLHEKMHNHGFGHSGGMTYGYPAESGTFVKQHWANFYDDTEVEKSTATLAVNYSLLDFGDQFKLEISLLDKNATEFDERTIDRFMLLTTSLPSLKQSLLITGDDVIELSHDENVAYDGTYIFSNIIGFIPQTLNTANSGQVASKLVFIFDKPEEPKINNIPASIVFIGGSEKDLQQQSNLVVHYSGDSGFKNENNQRIYITKKHLKNEEGTFISDYENYTPLEAEDFCQKKGLTLGTLEPFKTTAMIEFQNKYLKFGSQVGLDSKTGEPIAVSVPSGYLRSKIYETDKGSVIVCSQ